MDVEALKKLKVAELRDRLQELELPTAGKKEELIQRLVDFHSTATDDGSIAELDDADLIAPPSATSGTSKQPELNVTAAAPVAVISPTLPTTPSVAKAPAQVSSGLSEEEKRRLRAQRFGIPYVEPSAAKPKPAATAAVNKPTKPAEPTATTSAVNLKKVPVAPAPIAVDPEVLKKRQERFGPVEQPQKKTKLSPTVPSTTALIKSPTAASATAKP